MNAIEAGASAHLGDTWATLAVSLAIGIAMMALVLGMSRASSAFFNPTRRRLAGLREPELLGTSSDKPRRAAWFWAWLEPKAETAENSGLRLTMMQAGYRSVFAPGLYLLSRIAFIVVLPGIVWLTHVLMPHSALKGPWLILAMLSAAGVGFLFPAIFLENRRNSRIDELMRGFPDALDLLVACTEAGLSFNAAVDRVAEQMPASHPILATELALVNAEIRAGVDRAVALHNLVERNGLEEVRGLVSLISQSNRLGTGIASTLRLYSEEFRDRRLQHAEERAALIGTKLIFPLVFTLWPSFFLVAVGPAVIGVIRAMSQSTLIH